MDDIDDPPDLSRPPQPPELPRRIRLHRPQWIGIPLLMLIPVLALLGLFGETHRHAWATGPEVRVDVEYPGRLRRGQRSEIRLHVENVSDRPLDTVTVTFDPTYINRFANVSFTPEPRLAYHVELVGLQPRESMLVRVEMEGERSWRHTGEIAVAPAGADGARVRIDTFVFP